MADLNQFLNKDLSIDDVQHSSGIGAVAGGGGAGGLSMEQRRQLLNQPRVVGSYNYSQLGRRFSSVKARTYDQKKGQIYNQQSDNSSTDANASNRQNAGIKDRGKIDTKSIERRQQYIEPKGRGFDKYA
jgi:hypothetical protein